MSKMCRALESILSISEKGRNWFKYKGNTGGNEIMHASKLHKNPNQKKIKNQHNATYTHIPCELYDMMMSVWKMEEELRHISNLRS